MVKKSLLVFFLDFWMIECVESVSDRHPSDKLMTRSVHEKKNGKRKGKPPEIYSRVKVVSKIPALSVLIDECRLPPPAGVERYFLSCRHRTSELLTFTCCRFVLEQLFGWETTVAACSLSMVWCVWAFNQRLKSFFLHALGNFLILGNFTIISRLLLLDWWKVNVQKDIKLLILVTISALKSGVYLIRLCLIRIYKIFIYTQLPVESPFDKTS